MSRLKQQWRSLSPESKVGSVLMPLVLAVFVGLVVPEIRDALKHETTPERRATVKVLDVERDVPLSDFVAANDGAKAPPMGMVLAAYVDDEATGDGTADQDESTGEHQTGGDETGDQNQTAGEGEDGGQGQDDDTGETGGQDQDDDAGGTGGQDQTDDTGGTGGQGQTDDTTGTAGQDQNADSDGDGVRDADDICPHTPGEPTTGCAVAELRVEPFGCTDQQMVETLARDKDGTERCDDLSAVVGGATGSKPGDVEARAEAVAAALQETRSTSSIGHGGRREPMGVVVSIEATVKGFVGKHIRVTWSLRQANGGRLPHKWLKNRPVLQLTGKATSDTGSADFWVPLPKRPHGPFVVRLTMKDDDGTPLTFAKSGRIA